jgi:hypothetical protein
MQLEKSLVIRIQQSSLYKTEDVRRNTYRWSWYWITRRKRVGWGKRERGLNPPPPPPNTRAGVAIIYKEENQFPRQCSSRLVNLLVASKLGIGKKQN